jgi:hypothetical protein
MYRDSCSSWRGETSVLLASARLPRSLQYHGGGGCPVLIGGPLLLAETIVFRENRRYFGLEPNFGHVFWFLAPFGGAETGELIHTQRIVVVSPHFSFFPPKTKSATPLSQRDKFNTTGNAGRGIPGQHFFNCIRDVEFLFEATTRCLKITIYYQSFTSNFKRSHLRGGRPGQWK